MYLLYTRATGRVQLTTCLISPSAGTSTSAINVLLPFGTPELTPHPSSSLISGKLHTAPPTLPKHNKKNAPPFLGHS